MGWYDDYGPGSYEDEYNYHGSEGDDSLDSRWYGSEDDYCDGTGSAHQKRQRRDYERDTAELRNAGDSPWSGDDGDEDDEYRYDQHDLDDDTKERTQPVLIGDWVWVTADVTVLRGVEIGSHSVIRTRSVVTRSIPSHTLADGSPAEPRRAVGDRKLWLRNPQDL